MKRMRGLEIFFLGCYYGNVKKVLINKLNGYYYYRYF
jgi:hypothetical protein